MAERKEYKIKIQGQLISVSEEIYLEYYRMKRRELHLEEKDKAHRVFLYSALDTEETSGEDAIPDITSPKVEDVVTDKLLAEKLHQCLNQLTKEEQELIYILFFQNKSEHQVSRETGIAQKTIHNRKVRILSRLKKLLEN
ncbi:sigma factor-like helix-turn-helix DNA-binding protein [Sedimentibacter sp.]|uniref:sigma factor-like helix-turn-helix DNA-binding protein n=1 Tax=Sedimentibacter sp. TaxID=1960295 RepID=UPI00289EC367|nr:sigma factor-like helix-turn-helix DNA-binding protein [Sedimentibacter sp.]